MRALPLDIGILHFVGVGGIGMSGIAEVLHTLGYQVRGSDQNDGANVIRLRDLGIPVEVGHRPENVEGAAVVVISSAVKADNPEVMEARARMIPVVRRAEMLAELMRLKWSIACGGTHGKTTTTSLVAGLLDSAGLDPTVINGGIINAYGTNARLGKGDWMVVEADESDGTFVKLPATIAIVTNIDPEHLDFYGSVEAMHAAYETFVGNIPFYGFAALCIDHPAVQRMVGHLSDRRVITYGLSPQADVRAIDLAAGAEAPRFNVVTTNRVTGDEHRLTGLRLPMLGQHNVQNALAAITIALEMEISEAQIRAGLSSFRGVKRRFTKTGEAGGITVIDDYGHHPVEISAVLKAARARQVAGGKGGRVLAVVQPHRYTRLSSLFDEFCSCFNDADCVIVADVYAAGEAPIEGADRDSLIQGLRTHGHRRVVGLDAPEDLPDLVADLAAPGDLVVCLGAGSITAWANALPAQLEKRLAAGGPRRWEHWA